MDAAERPRTSTVRSSLERPARAAAPLATTDHGDEITALVQLARLDRSLTEGGVTDRAGREREALTAKVSPETLDAYHRALRAGRQPALVPVEGSVCCGCHMRLHSSLAQSIRRRGAAACPHCLRVVYDASRLQPTAHS